MKHAVLVFPGINRERDITRALKSLGVDGVVIENYRVEVLG